MEKDLEREIILRKHRITCRTGVNPLELDLDLKETDSINGEYRATRMCSSLSYSFEK